MRFRGFRSFPFRPTNNAERYIGGDLNAALKDLFAGLLRLNFQDNFQSFSEEVIIKSGEEASITNKLSDGIPTLRIIARQQGNGLLTDGGQWDTDKVSIKNHGPDDVTATIIFMR